METQTSSAMPEQNYSKDYSRYFISLAIMLAGAMIGLGLYLGMQGGKETKQEGPSEEMVTTKEQMQELIKSSPTVLVDPSAKNSNVKFIGRADAPITMTYWFDYQCPFCKAVDVGHDQIPTEPSMDKLVEEYVNTGKLKIVFKDYPFLGKDSIVDAEYAHAVWKLYPDKFFAWHEAMMYAQDAEGDVGFGNEETVKILTSLVQGIDTDKVTEYVASHKDALDKAIEAEQKSGVDVGVQATPAFRIGSKSIDGAVPYVQFETAINAQLKK